MTTESHTVLCGQCHRTVAVAVSNMHLPCFRNVEEQADCRRLRKREARARDSANDDVPGSDRVARRKPRTRRCRRVVDPEGAWQVACRILTTQQVLFPGQAPRAGEIWDRCGPSQAGAAISLMPPMKRIAGRPATAGLCAGSPVLAMSVVVAGAAWFSRAAAAERGR